MDLYTYWLMEKAAEEEHFEKIAFKGPAWQKPFRDRAATMLRGLRNKGQMAARADTSIEDLKSYLAERFQLAREHERGVRQNFKNSLPAMSKETSSLRRKDVQAMAKQMKNSINRAQESGPTNVALKRNFDHLEQFVIPNAPEIAKQKRRPGYNYTGDFTVGWKKKGD